MNAEQLYRVEEQAIADARRDDGIRYHLTDHPEIWDAYRLSHPGEVDIPRGDVSGYQSLLAVTSCSAFETGIRYMCRWLQDHPGEFQG